MIKQSNSFFLFLEKNSSPSSLFSYNSLNFFENLEAALSGRDLDYLVVHHMEPDHAALLSEVKRRFPNLKIVCTAKALAMVKQFFSFDAERDVQIVKEGDTLLTGSHELVFFAAPMVHWPEVMVTYDKTTGTLFSADAFGSFGAINGNLFDDEVDWERDYLDEARRYYSNIVGKYGLQVQMLLKKVSTLDVKMICPLHSLIIRKNIELFIEKYNKWSTYTPEENSVLIVYSSVYGGTENTVDIIAAKLADRGVCNIKMFDISYVDTSRVLAEAFRVSHVVLATTTYNAGVFESMLAFVHSLVAHNLQNRKFVLIENGSWAPTCGGQMKSELEKLKGSEFLVEPVCVKSSLKEDKLAELDNVVITIEKSLNV